MCTELYTSDERQQYLGTCTPLYQTSDNETKALSAFITVQRPVTRGDRPFPIISVVLIDSFT
jgi:hypothetical protein